MFLDIFLIQLFPNYLLNFSSEDDEKYTCQLSSKTVNPIYDQKKVSDSLLFLHQRDLLIINVTPGDLDAIQLKSNNININKFADEIIQSASYLNEYEVLIIDISIEKKKVNNTITIYHIDSFINHLSSIKFHNGLSIFNRVLKKSNYIIFEVLDIDKPFNTQSIYFTPISGNIIYPFESRDRLQKIERIKTVSFFTNIEDYTLTPDDFKLLTCNEEYKEFNEYLHHYSTILSIIYLFDISTLSDDELEFKINGYKSIKGNINTNDYPLRNTSEYFDIYSWTYNGGNLNDKIGLARNIISLHFETPESIAIKGNPFQSIQSSYKIYEKQNIKQYIEIRNKISDQLVEFNVRANRIIENFALGFQRSAFALISFYFSAIAIKVLSKGNFSNIFTLDVTLLSIGFLIISFIYFAVSRWEVLEQRNRFSTSYKNLKDRYTDLLETEDIERILNNDKEYKTDILFIQQKLRTYSTMWIIFVLILLTISIILFFATYLNIASKLITKIFST